MISPGSVVRVTSDFPAIRSDELSATRGEHVHVVSFSVERGYFVRRSSDDGVQEEGWIPSHVLAQVTPRKPWSFRFRKPSFSTGGRRGERRSFDGGMNPPPILNSGGRLIAQEVLIPECPVTLPEFSEHLHDLSISSGSRVELRCCLRTPPHVCDLGDVNIVWRKSSNIHRLNAHDTSVPNILRTGGRFSISLNENGTALLVIENCQASDAGEYTCTASNDAGSVTTSACLSITGLWPDTDHIVNF